MGNKSLIWEEGGVTRFCMCPGECDLSLRVALEF